MPNKKIIVVMAMAGFLLFCAPHAESLRGTLDKKLEKNYVRIMFAGDLMFDRGIRYYAEKNGGNDYIFEKVSDLLKQNDLNVVNLEGPITNNKSVSSGTAPGSENNYKFTFDKGIAKTLFDQNIKIVNLGNNHIENFGYAGLNQTKKYLDEAGVDYFGAPDYPRSISTEINGIKITFVNYNEFSALQENEAPETINEIQKTKGFSDLIIIYCHWGVEYAPEPTEEQKQLAREFIDSGADLVIGSHPHVIQTTETYKNKRIYYSLGNFIFDQYFDEGVRKGLGVVVKIDKTTRGMGFAEKNFYLQTGGQTIVLSPALFPEEQK
ncbi:MAG: hypothetical protein A2599_02895 [Candidatus Staskawiczbacteria bacterium RIFOXYD1_FULL_39_28]|uniref:Capsule synthesis protein CapA domain-containing protein n=1 Tax=Candidatus Staskawiczbacteria bacterium RIFOXYC1_FULL_38_18 TaxID=1802229 RepID=A0A1G2JC53_9BACT|nr:MAG: hypothetical protein A2401_01110 [Candidatus Staskawiczbacteria bacterium RIFOXYC1_FULL_38_18]OGZ92323.1 MAG: hypothetical protein A2599_02895 [Candidatus Staskawiczbacteria bacterium RIFOXYD1_FULL_39_28]